MKKNKKSRKQKSKPSGKDHIFLDPVLKRMPGMNMEEQIRFDLRANGIHEMKIIDVMAAQPELTLLGRNLRSDLLKDKANDRPVQGFLYLVRMALKDGTKINNYYYSKGGDFFGKIIESVEDPWKPGYGIKIHPEHLSLIKNKHRNLVIPLCLVPDLELYAATVLGEQ